MAIVVSEIYADCLKSLASFVEDLVSACAAVILVSLLSTFWFLEDQVADTFTPIRN